MMCTKNVSDRLNLVNVSQAPLINLLHFDFYGHTHTVSCPESAR